MRKSHLLIVIFIICSICLSFSGCAGNRDSRRDATKIEDDYKSDRDRMDHGGY